MTPYIAAFDYSMTCPALTLLSGGNDWANTTIHYVTDKEKYQGKYAHKKLVGHPYPNWKTPMDRYIELACLFMGIIAERPNWRETRPKIFLEGYSMGSRGKVFHIAENTAILKYLMHQNEFVWEDVPPTTLKKWATGSGGGKKDAMGIKFKEWTGIDLAKTFFYEGKKPYDTSPLSDIADSYLLARYGWETQLKDSSCIPL